MTVAKLDEMKDLKSPEMKVKWRAFCEEFKHVEDYSFATLIRLDSRYKYCIISRVWVAHQKVALPLALALITKIVSGAQLSAHFKKKSGAHISAQTEENALIFALIFAHEWKIWVLSF